ncbi:ankyrin repeat domain-containing protein [Candidatus Babeliales bacterium]|nr:ankyrin repeat domain-containing protein [Candidatus Babeliales bacterium]
MKHMDITAILVTLGFSFTILSRPIHEAVEQQDRAEVERILATSPSSVNEQNEGGETALYIAARRGDHKTARLLLRNEADPKKKCSLGRTPLHSATDSSFGTLWVSTEAREQAQVARLLLEHDATLVNEVDGRRRTALSMIMKQDDGPIKADGPQTQDHHDFMQILLQAGVSPNAPINREGDSALGLAAEMGSEKWYHYCFDTVLEPILAITTDPRCLEQYGKESPHYIALLNRLDSQHLAWKLLLELYSNVEQAQMQEIYTQRHLSSLQFVEKTDL